MEAYYVKILLAIFLKVEKSAITSAVTLRYDSHKIAL